MAYDERVANRIREALANQPLVEEKTLFQGLAFMVDDKLCVCVRNDVLLCRIGPDEYEAALEMNGVEPMIMNGRVANGYVYVSPQGYASREAFDSWIAKCVAFNKVAKSSKKKK
jgi:hypothetical protein